MLAVYYRYLWYSAKPIQVPKRSLLFLIDDNRVDQLFFQLAAKRVHRSIDCEFADDGQTALEMLSNRAFIPDIIFIDINMPVMNGLECLRKIKKIKHLKAIPLYMYSTSADPNITNSCRTLGASGVMKKEPSISRLSQMLFSIISKLGVNVE